MACRCAPSLLALLSELDHYVPNRSKASDGCCASPTHTSQNPTSDHETGDARDYTHSPSFDAHAFADHLRQLCQSGAERRLAYIISNGRICTAWAKNGVPPWTWRPYSGTNPHDKHIHLSLDTKNRDQTRNDLSPWVGDYFNEDDMTPEQHQQLANAEKSAGEANGRTIELVNAVGRMEQMLGDLARAVVAESREDAKAIVDELVKRLEE